jgi:hypothetical protein
VKAAAALFKKIRRTTTKNRRQPIRRSVAGRQQHPPGRGGRGPGCQVRHAPLQACGASKATASKYSEYMDMFNNALTCIVFVPIFWPTEKTLHHSRGKVTENLRMIRPCAAIAETEGTCPGSARAYVCLKRLLS